MKCSSSTTAGIATSLAATSISIAIKVHRQPRRTPALLLCSPLLLFVSVSPVAKHPDENPGAASPETSGPPTQRLAKPWRRIA
ncbi:hypothetical protein LXL04_032390 [Taraxacum kok-saghyz]